MTWRDVETAVILLAAIAVAVAFAVRSLVDWRMTRKAGRVLADSLDHAMRPSEQVSLNAWMHVPDQPLGMLAEALSPDGVSPIEPATLAWPRDAATLTAQLIGSARPYA